MNSTTPKFVHVGDIVEIELGASEVCLHMRVTGQIRRVHIVATDPEETNQWRWAAQILSDVPRADGSLDAPFGAPITLGEAGFYITIANGVYYYPPIEADTPSTFHTSGAGDLDIPAGLAAQDIFYRTHDRTVECER